MRTTTSPPALDGVDACKAVAALAIVAHHAALYSALVPGASDGVRAVAAFAEAWGRLAVPVFLAVAGFLAARSVLEAPAAGWAAFGRRLRLRYLRLGVPLLFALVAATAVAALVRAAGVHPEPPSPTSALQWAAHALFLQDLLGVVAISPGVWYVAIDWQLHAGLVALAAFAGPFALPVAIAVGLASLWGFNRDPALDSWGLYFAGAYALGVAAWAAGRTGSAASRALWIAGIALAVAVALVLEFRSRVLVAGLVAVALAAPAFALPQRLRAACAALSRVSYGIFLIHPAVILAVDALVLAAWPGPGAAHTVGWLVAIAASVPAGAALEALVRRVPMPRR